MKCKKRSVTLIETIIAMSLLSLLMLFLFGFYRDMAGIDSQLERVKEENFRFLYLQSKLSSLFSLVSDEHQLLGKSERRSLFFSTKEGASSFKGNSLVFIYDNGVNIDPLFSRNVLARLYLDQQGRLCFATWPSPWQMLREERNSESKAMHWEVLLTDISSLSFEFYLPPRREERRIYPREIHRASEEKTVPNPPGTWHEEWRLAYQELPAMVKVIIKLKATAKAGQETSSPLIFVFPVAHANKKIFYR